MPTYEYLCASCNHRFERFQSITDESHANCPSCGEPAKRLISVGAGIIVKGTKSAQTACGQDVPCCGRGEPCGKSGECH